MLVIEVLDESTASVIHFTGSEETDDIQGISSSLTATKQSALNCKSLIGAKEIKEGPIDFSKNEVFLMSYQDNVPLYKPEDAIRRARSKLGETDYHIFSHNCESFVNWALTAHDVTDQGGNAAAAAGWSILTFGAVVVLAVVSYVVRK